MSELWIYNRLNGKMAQFLRWDESQNSICLLLILQITEEAMFTVQFLSPQKPSRLHLLTHDPCSDLICFFSIGSMSERVSQSYSGGKHWNLCHIYISNSYLDSEAIYLRGAIRFAVYSHKPQIHLITHLLKSKAEFWVEIEWFRAAYSHWGWSLV